MTETSTTPTPTKKPARSAKSSSRTRSHAKKTGKPGGSMPNAQNNANAAGQGLALNFKAEAGEDNPIWQAVNYAYNRWCGAHQNSITPVSGIELVAYTREKFGPRVMTAGGGNT